jgi:hypothetical protein
MRSMQPPAFAHWLLKNLGCGPNNDAVIGDLNEQLSTGHSRLWYRRQVLIAIIVSVSKDIWMHKLLALRGLIIGWVLFGYVYGGFSDYALPVFGMVTKSLFDKLYTIAGSDMGFRRWVVTVGNSPLYVYEALWTLGLFVTGAVTGAVVGLLHRRKVSVVLLLAVFVLMHWISQGITQRLGGDFYLVTAMLIVGIVMGGVLCRSHHQRTVTEK